MEHPRRPLVARLVETVRVYGPLGWTAFGGTAANILLSRRVFVQQEKWVSPEDFADLFTLGSALPGPAFSQLAFSISLLHAGYAPAFLSFVLLTAPGAILMLGAGFLVQKIPEILPPVVYALFSGLNAAAVALVAVAAYKLSQTVITDKMTRLTVLASAGIACCYDAQWLYPVMMVAGGTTTLLYDIAAARLTDDKGGEAEDSPSTTITSSTRTTRGHGIDDEREPLLARTGTLSHSYFGLSIKAGLSIVAFFFAFLAAVLIIRIQFPGIRALDFSANLLLAGTLIFGGGPVVIPLLRAYTVDPGWVTPRDFLLGFAIIQALPGPLFNFAVFLGVLVLPDQRILGGLLGCLSIFAPGILIKLGVLPLYQRWKKNLTARRVLRGLNATAVGLIFAAVYQLFHTGLILPSDDPALPAQYASLDADGWYVVITASAFIFCDSFNLFPPFAILGGAVGGVAWWAVKGR